VNEVYFLNDLNILLLIFNQHILLLIEKSQLLSIFIPNPIQMMKL